VNKQNRKNQQYVLWSEQTKEQGEDHVWMFLERIMGAIEAGHLGRRSLSLDFAPQPVGP
jgi:hypothetical protein